MYQPECDVNWFLGQLRKFKSMGPMTKLIKMVPGMSQQMDSVDIDESELDRSEAIILAMTPWERRHVGLIDVSRQQRIAQGSGVQGQEVSHLLTSFHLIRVMKRSIEERLQ